MWRKYKFLLNAFLYHIFIKHLLCSDHCVHHGLQRAHQGKPYNKGGHPLILHMNSVFSHLSLCKNFLFTGISWREPNKLLTWGFILYIQCKIGHPVCKDHTLPIGFVFWMKKMASCSYSHCQSCMYTLAWMKPRWARLMAALAWFLMKTAQTPAGLHLPRRTQLGPGDLLARVDPVCWCSHRLPFLLTAPSWWTAGEVVVSGTLQIRNISDSSTTLFSTAPPPNKDKWNFIRSPVGRNANCICSSCNVYSKSESSSFCVKWLCLSPSFFGAAWSLRTGMPLALSALSTLREASSLQGQSPGKACGWCMQPWHHMCHSHIKFKELIETDFYPWTRRNHMWDIWAQSKSEPNSKLTTITNLTGSLFGAC